MRSAALAGALAIMAGAAASRADDDAAAAAARKATKQAKAEAKRQGGETIEIHGRVFARGTASREETAVGAGTWTSALELASARIEAQYQWRERVRAEVSFEAARGSIRDAFVELPLASGLRLRAGRMKLPVGAVEQTSGWTLPTIGRGMVADVLSDGLGITGRRSAVELRWRGKAALRPTLTLTAAQGVRTSGGEQPGAIDDGGGLTLAGRASVEPCAMYTIAVSAASRVVNYGSAVARYWNASLEFEVDGSDADLGLRVWGDLTYGQSHLGAAQLGDAERPFAAGELIAGYRFGGRDRNTRYLEPYLGAGWMNPVADRKRDDTTEVVIGVAGGLWKRWRAQAQFAYQNAKALRPAGLLGTADVNDRQTVSLQLGTAF